MKWTKHRDGSHSTPLTLFVMDVHGKAYPIMKGKATVEKRHARPGAYVSVNGFALLGLPGQAADGAFADEETAKTAIESLVSLDGCVMTPGGWAVGK